MLDTKRTITKASSDVAHDTLVNSSDAEPQTAVTRLDPITNQLTIFATSRGQRPNNFQLVHREKETPSTACPFCNGAEDKTPAAVWLGRSIGTKRNVDSEIQNAFADCGNAQLLSGTQLLCGTQCIDDPNVLSDLPSDEWSVRVVPNKYPAISIGSDFQAPQKTSSPLFQEQAIQGGHEVIIESPQHHRSICELDLSNVALVFAAYRDRIRYWSEVPGTEYISVFKNSGGDAGASLPHCHSQLIATNQMPPNVHANIKRMSKHRAQTGCCLQCDLIRAELKEKTRIIAKTDSLVAYCPFASRFPLMVRITTRQHCSRFETLPEQTIESVAYLVKRVASWLETSRPGVAYNYLLHTQPPGSSDGDSFHWSLEIFPRLARIAGFEFSSDCMINPMMPETAAAELRACAAAEDPRLVR